MIVGTAISIVGYGLLTTIGVDTPTVLWAAYLAICGLGMGSGMNVPYTALQAVLRYGYFRQTRRSIITDLSKVRTTFLQEMVIMLPATSKSDHMD